MFYVSLGMVVSENRFYSAVYIRMYYRKAIYIIIQRFPPFLETDDYSNFWKLMIVLKKIFFC